MDRYAHLGRKERLAWLRVVAQEATRLIVLPRLASPELHRALDVSATGSLALSLGWSCRAVA